MVSLVYGVIIFSLLGCDNRTDRREWEPQPLKGG